MKVFLTASIILAGSLSAYAQSVPDQTTLDVVATDKAGFVKGLTAKDIKVWVDSKEQSVTSAAIRSAEKHAVVLLFDATSISVQQQADIRGYVAKFIDAAVTPNTYMEVVTYSTGMTVLQPFTTNPALLKTALNGTAASTVASSAAGGGGGGATLGGRATGQTSLGDSSASGNDVMKSQQMMESLRAFLDSLAPVRGRKAVIFFTGGQAFSSDATVQVNNALDAANRANVAIYGVSDNTAYAKTFSDATGGTSLKVTGSMPAALQQIIQEQDAAYAVAFSDPGGTGCHQLRVKADPAGVDLRAAKSFCSPNKTDALAGTAAGKDLDARLGGTAAGNLGVSVQAPWFAGKGPQTRVAVAIDAASSGMKFQKVKGGVHAELNAAGAAYHKDGTVAAHFSETLPFDFADQKQADAFLKLPFHYENQLMLSPGDYSIKAAISPGGDVFGKAEVPISIEGADLAKFSAGGIALSRELRNLSSGASGLPTDMLEGVTPLVASGKQIVPTGNAKFQKGERALFYVEIYEPALASGATAQVSMRFRVLERASGAMKSDSGDASVAGYIKAGNSVIGAASTVPTAALTPGAYRLEITATHASGPEKVVRTVDFELN